MGAEIIQLIPSIPIDENCLARVRELTTAQLKYMWDDRGGRWDTLCDEIHMVMNERGEGAYVAV